jgi:hypothetical protein
LTTLYFAGAENTNSWRAMKGNLQRAFPLDVPIVYSSRHTFVANGNNPTGIGLTPGETICFGSLELTADRFGCLSLSPKRVDQGVVFIGMVHSGSLSLHTTLEESFDEGSAASDEGGALDSSVVVLIVPIITTLASKNTLTFLTILTVLMRTTAPQPGIGLLLDQL